MRPAAALAVLALFAPRAGGAQPTTFSVEATRRLDAGEVLTKFWQDQDAGVGWAVSVVDAPPEKVFQVVADVEPGSPTGSRKTRFRLLARLCRVGLMSDRAPLQGFSLPTSSCAQASLAHQFDSPIVMTSMMPPTFGLSAQATRSCSQRQCRGDSR